MNKILQKPAPNNYEPRGRLDPEGFDRHVTFKTFAPPEDLEPFIEHFWIITWQGQDTPYYSEEVMHRPYVDAFISRQESGIQGTFRGKRTYIAKGDGKIIGVRFKPGAFHAFWSGAMSTLQDRVVPLPEAFPKIDVERLLGLNNQATIEDLGKTLRACQPKADPSVVLVNKIIAAIEADPNLQTVASVATTFKKSERWLQQLFQVYLGIGLKWLLQRQKLLAAAKQIRQSDSPNWALIAYDIGYSSQQHFITDFKHVLGKTPLQYKRELTQK